MMPRFLAWENISSHYHPVLKCVCWDGDKENRVEDRLACPRDSGNDLVWNVSLGSVGLAAFSVEVEALMRTDELTNGVMIVYSWG